MKPENGGQELRGYAFKLQCFRNFKPPSKHLSKLFWEALVNPPRLIERICKACGQQFQARVKDVLRGNGWACSRRCSGQIGGRARSQASRHLGKPHTRQEELRHGTKYRDNCNSYARAI